MHVFSRPPYRPWVFGGMLGNIIHDPLDRVMKHIMKCFVFSWHHVSSEEVTTRRFKQARGECWLNSVTSSTSSTCICTRLPLYELNAVPKAMKLARAQDETPRSSQRLPEAPKGSQNFPEEANRGEYFKYRPQWPSLFWVPQASGMRRCATRVAVTWRDTFPKMLQICIVATTKENSFYEIARDCPFQPSEQLSRLESWKEAERVWVVRNTFIEVDKAKPTLPRKKTLENHSP